MSCPVPFLSAADFPPTGGYLPGRLCSAVTSTLTCCLPCNKQKWTYTNEFNRNLDVAFWLNVPSLIALVLLLITFAALPAKQSHRHYLNIGLCVGLSLLCIAFVIPLASRPDYCYNEITPRDMYSSTQCGFSGAFFIAGTLTATTWVLARSLWIHLRLCWNFKDERVLMWPLCFIGWGLPAILFSVAMSVTTVSFRLGDTCLPGQKYPFLTYLGWLMAFGILALIFQLATTFYCLWIYLREVISGPAPGTTRSGTHGRFGPAVSSQAQNGENTVARRGSDTPTARKATWRRTKVVLKTQWRSILLSFIVSADTVLYGFIFAAQDAKTTRIMAGTEDSRLVEWATCLILNDLDPNKCRGIPNLLNEKAFISNFILAAINGMLIFLAMYRTSMATGWWYIIRHGRRQPEAEDHFKIVPMKRRTPAQKLESDRYNPAPHEIDPTLLNPMPHPYQPDSHAQRSQASLSRSYEPSLIDFEGQDDTMASRVGQKSSFNSSPLRSNPPHGPGLLPDAPDTPDSRKPSARGSDTTAIGTPEPGDAAKRHETTTWFEENSSDDEEVGAPRPRRKFNDIV